MFKIVIFLAVAAWGSTEGSEFVNGTCPNWQDLPRYIPDAGLLNKYVYQHKTLNNYLFKEEGRCTTLFNTNARNTLYSIYRQESKDNKTDTGVAVPYVEDFPTTRTFKLRFEGSDQPKKDKIMTAMIVATDNENYGVLYSCRSGLDESLELDTNPKKMETVLVFTAKRGDTSFDEKIKSELAAIDLDYDSFKVTDQSNC